MVPLDTRVHAGTFPGIYQIFLKAVELIKASDFLQDFDGAGQLFKNVVLGAVATTA